MSVLCVFFAQNTQAQVFQTQAPQAILMDYATGTILFDKAGDILVEPASMTKMMTAAVLFEELSKGRLRLEDEMTVSEKAWRKGSGTLGSSSMFLQLGSRVKVQDLLQGLLVHSGNDAAVTLAEGLAGSENAFAKLMTGRARELRLPKSVFMNASGVSDPEQRSTVRELGKIAAHIIETYPDYYKYFSQREFTWNRVRQQNRNPLLTMDIGVDGLKTGNVADSGFGLAASAIQNGQRLIVVVHGLKTPKDRAQEARKLLEWGWRSFETKKLFDPDEKVGSARVFGGNQRYVTLISKKGIQLLAPRGGSDRLKAQIVYTGPVAAPIQKDQLIGHLVVMRGDIRALEAPLYAADDVPLGGITERAYDAMTELTHQLFQKALGK